MKHCAQCEFTFDDQVQICDFDGTELSVVPERPPSFKTVSFAPQASESFLRRVVKTPAVITALAMAGVALSALLIGYNVSVNRRDVDSSKPQTQSDRAGIATPVEVDATGQVEKQADRPRTISTQRRIRADELPSSMVKRLLKGSHSRSVRSGRDISSSGPVAAKRRAGNANSQARARNPSRPHSREAGNANRQSRVRDQARPDSREQVRQQHSSALVANRRSVATDNESVHRRKDSKVVAILKKTGKILKKPFELFARR